MRFDAIFVDEAGQCSEPECLTPLRLAFSGYVLPAPTTTTSSGISASYLGIPVPVEGHKEGRSGRLGDGYSTVPPWVVRSACSRLVLIGDPLQVRQRYLRVAHPALLSYRYLGLGGS